MPSEYGPRRFVVKPWGRGRAKGYAVFDRKPKKAAFPGAWKYMKDSKRKSRGDAESLAKQLEAKG